MSRATGWIQRFSLRRSAGALALDLSGAPPSFCEGGDFDSVSRFVIPNPLRRMRNLLFAVAFVGWYPPHTPSTIRKSRFTLLSSTFNAAW